MKGSDKLAVKRGRPRKNKAEPKKTIEQIEQPAEKEQQLAPEVVITTKETQPLQVEVSKKTTDNSSTIADEIVGNLKMVGFAFVLFAVYMLGFMLVHQKDIKEYDYPNNSYFGESCYDPNTISGNWKFDWEEHYYETLYWQKYHQIPFHFTSKYLWNFFLPFNCTKKYFHLPPR